jgi:hypothetical protein
MAGVARIAATRREGYVAIHVQRPSGSWYRTPFYRCFGCSVMFRHPDLFSQQWKITSDPNAMGGAHRNAEGYPWLKNDDDR